VSARIWLGVTVALACTGQTASYEVSSIRPGKSGGQSELRLTVRGGLFGKNVSLLDLIEAAYGLPQWRIVGEKPWVRNEKFDIEAKGPEAKQAISAEQSWEMLRSLLAVRFRLKIHHEQREHSFLALVAARNGPKLTEANTATCFAVRPTTKPEDMKGLRPCGGFYGHRGDIVGLKVTLGTLARQIEPFVGTVVRDETGLGDRVYDVRLRWDATDPMSVTPRSPRSETAGPAPAAPAGPSIFTALEEQLGLRLESRKGPVEFIVADEAEQPDDN